MHRIVYAQIRSGSNFARFHICRRLVQITDFPKKYVQVPIFSGKSSLNALTDIQVEIRRSGTHPLLFHKTHDFVAIYDQFPKSKYHLLVLPKYASYQSIHSLDASKFCDLRFLVDMTRFGDEIIHTVLKKIEPGRVFISGFHTIPSLYPIHMHVMSIDLDGHGMKKRKHYNSFTTSFFLESHRTLQKMINRASLDAKAYCDIDLQKLPMKCLWCEKPLEHVESWKVHLPNCNQCGIKV